MARKLKVISDSIISQLEISLNQKIPLAPKSFMRVLAKSTASVYVMLEHYADFMLRQWFINSCSDKELEVSGQSINPLDYWGDLIGLDGRKSGSRAEMRITVAVDQIGAVMVSGTQLQSPVNGYTYIVLSDTVLASSTVTLDIKAADDPEYSNGIGSSGNLSVGDKIYFVNPLSQVDKEAEISSITSQGTDPEPADEYRQRGIQAFRRRKQGGAYVDYQLWAESVSGIRSAYVYTGRDYNNPSVVDVYVEATPESSGSADGVPTPTQLDDVKEAINYDKNSKASRRPVGVFVNTLAITRAGFNVEITGLAVDNPVRVKAQIFSALTEFFLDAEPYIVGLTTPPRRDIITEMGVKGIILDIVRASSGTYTDATITNAQTSASVTNYTLAKGEKAKLTGVTYA